MSMKEPKPSADDAEGGAKKKTFSRRRNCKFCGEEVIKIDYKDPGLLKYFITDRGKLVPRRLTGNCAKHQRAIVSALNAPA